MIECLITAPQSGSGKTVMTCALLAAMKARGLIPCAFKAGPDYIDPMFHRAVLKIESHNLDLFLSDEETVRRLYTRYSARHGAAVCEGAMGYYDGLGGTTPRASAWHLADTLALPALLVLRPKGTSLTLAAAVRGLRDFKPNSRLAGILLNDCRPGLYAMLAPMLESETGLPVLGYLPPMPEAELQSRHLGLCTAAEIADLARRINALGRQAEQTIDLDRLTAVCSRPRESLPAQPPAAAVRARIAVAQDKAFCFCYAETLDALRAAGAEPVFFSPLQDAALPECGGLYLPGGYPELYAEALAKNSALRADILRRIQNGLPTAAECGGFLYLGRTLQGTDGTAYPMVGALPGDGVRTGHLVRFGYAELTAARDSLLFRAGETIPVHEFHYWDSTQNGAELTERKPLTGRSYACGFASPTLYAAFPHLYWAGAPQLARRFVQAAGAYQKERAL